MRFPNDDDDVVFVFDDGAAADSRFFSESFFSRCSRCTGGAGVFEAGREGAGAGAGAGAGDAVAGAIGAS